MSTLSIAEAADWAAAVLARNGCSKENAHSVACALVSAEADGRGTACRGCLRTCRCRGRARSTARPVLRRPGCGPGVLAVDAAQSFAYPVLGLAVLELPAIAAGQGIAVAPIRRSSHCGAAGLPCETLAQRGLVALLFADTPGGMAPRAGASRCSAPTPHLRGPA